MDQVRQVTWYDNHSQSVILASDVISPVYSESVLIAAMVLSHKWGAAVDIDYLVTPRIAGMTYVLLLEVVTFECLHLF